MRGVGGTNRGIEVYYVHTSVICGVLLRDGDGVIQSQLVVSPTSQTTYFYGPSSVGSIEVGTAGQLDTALLREVGERGGMP